MPFILYAILGAVIGFLITTIIFVLFIKKKDYFGYIYVFRNEDNEVEMYLEMIKSPEEFMKKKKVTLKVKSR